MKHLRGRAVYRLPAGNENETERFESDFVAYLRTTIGDYTLPANISSHNNGPTPSEPCNKRDIAFYLAADYNVEIVSRETFVIPTTLWRSNGRYEAIEDLQVLCPEIAKTNAVQLLYTDGDSTYTCGYYFPASGGFIFTDYAHSIHNTEAFAILWPMIVNRFHLTRYIAGRAKKVKKQKRLIPRITLGADPEYEAIDSRGEVIDARSVLFRGSSDTTHEIGTDGAGSQIELRPKPGTPAKVVKELRRLMKGFCAKYPGYALSTEGGEYACGGHIHIGGVSDFGYTSDLVTLLDDFLGIPSLLTNGEARGEHYGRPGDVESKDWGFEYRTPPATIFANPKITKIALQITLGLVKTYYAQDMITYSDNRPSVEDYVKIAKVSKANAQMWLDFCHNTYASEIDCQSLWRIKVKRAKVAKTITFIGEFSSDFRQECDRFAHQIQRDVTIYVVSDLVNPTRQDCLTIPVVDLWTRTLPSILKTTKKRLCIGISAGLAANAYNGTLRAIANAIAKEARKCV